MELKHLISSVFLLILASGVIYQTVPFSSTEPSPSSLFQTWISTYTPSWSVSETAYRYQIFLKNLAIITTHNADHSKSYKMGINQFTSLTDQEFAQTYLKPKSMHKALESQIENVDLLGRSLKADVDWVAKGMVSDVKNQGQCGSCWAFSAVGSLESQALMNGKKGISLSEQQLVDCSKKYGNQGCNGGFNYQGLAYVKDHGITTSSAYPYTARTGACKGDGGEYKIGAVQSARGCTGILNALASRPLGVSVDANNWSRYSSGVFNDCKTSLDHDVLLVGATDSYYKIKNSWGSGWGEKGYIRLTIGNTCGICNDKSPWPQ